LFSFSLVLAMPHPARRGRREEPVDLVELLSSRDGDSHRILLEDTDYEIVLRHADVDRRSQEILARYRVPSDCSPDLMAMKTSPSADLVASASTGPSSSEPSATSTSAASE
jgi:hypothetical protein